MEEAVVVVVCGDHRADGAGAGTGEDRRGD